VSKKSWYKRKHQFTPYTKADGQAVSDEFDAVQTSFERIPEMRDDGKGFKDSPLIPEPTDPMHPVPLKMLTETEESVNNARDDVTAKAQQVAQNTQSVAANTLTATQKADTATQAAASAQSSQQAASNSENMAHKWAANPVNEVVQGDKYSAYHYAIKAAQSETTASSAAITSKNNADIATSKAEEAAKSAEKARSLADGEVEYAKILHVPSADTQTRGIVLLTNDTGLESESLGLTAKAGKKLAQMIATVQTSLTKYLLISKLSSSINSTSEDNVATSLAVKKAYDKAVEANNNADNKVPKDGNTTINGTLKAANPSGWSAFQFGASQGYWQLEVHPNSHEDANRRFNMLFIPNTGKRVYLAFPAISENGDTVAYRSWAVDKSGDTMTGDLSLKKGNYSGLNLYNNDGYYVRIEGNPHNDNNLLKLVYRTPKGENIAVATLPKKNGVIAYAGDVVSKSGDSMSGTLSFSGATDSYRIGSYTWRMPIKFSGDAVIGNEKCVIGFNNNGALHLGGLPDASQFNATLDGEKFWVAGDVKTALGRSLNKAHQNYFNFVSVKQSDGLGGLHINRQDGKSARFEYNNGRFKLWNEGKYDMYFPDKGGTLALTSDVVSDVRLGALVTKRLFRDLNSEGAVGAGYIVTGFRDIGDRFDNATGVFRPIQKHINGQWITISNA
jgi:putative phage tail fibre protein (fragment)